MGSFGANYGLNYDISGGDTTDPTISILSPSNGDSVVQGFTITGIAADNVEVSKVEVQIDSDGYNLASGTTSWSFPVGNITEGAHTITARATDTSGNTATAGPISITVTASSAKPISHVTLDAGTDLRKRPKKPQKQILKLSVEIPIKGNAKRKDTISIKNLGLAKRTQKTSTKLTGVATVTSKTMLAAKGSLKSINKTIAGISGKIVTDGPRTRGAKQREERRRKIDTLKQMLRDLDSL